jgi:hypothetical protein
MAGISMAPSVIRVPPFNCPANSMAGINRLISLTFGPERVALIDMAGISISHIISGPGDGLKLGDALGDADGDIDCDGLADGDCDALMLADGLRLALGLKLGDFDGLKLAEGDRLGEAEGLTLADGDRLGEPEGDSEGLLDGETLGLTDAEGLKLGEPEGLSLADGERLGLPEGDIDGLATTKMSPPIPLEPLLIVQTVLRLSEVILPDLYFSPPTIPDVPLEISPS